MAVMPVQTNEHNRAVQSGEKSDRKNLHVNIAARKFADKGADSLLYRLRTATHNSNTAQPMR